ncbi:MAG: HRDC domain-containing protein [Chloroflexota bacterium]|nr:HRDC domain-containing protein [Chloroflexota bacterium]
MQSNNLPKPIFIANPPALDRLADELARETIIAVDMEANGLYAYREQVCLIQFSTLEKDFLVDPISLGDISPLAPIFNNPDIEKVFHAAEFDLILLQRDFGVSLTNLFDTMVAARILGWKRVGLGNIIEKQFGIKVNKKYQRANWGKRPLSDEMLTYAQMDTHYLIELRQRIKNSLHEKDRWELAREDFRRGCQVNAAEHQSDPADPWRVKGAYDLDPQQAAVLQKLCQFRDQKARELDRPVFKVISNRALISITRQQPRNHNELKSIRGVSDRQDRWIGDKLLAAVRRGTKADPIYPPRKPRFSREDRDQTDRLLRWRKKKGRRMGVKSDVILPKDLLYELVKQNPTTKDELAQTLETVPWRLQHFGDEIFNLLMTSNYR